MKFSRPRERDLKNRQCTVFGKPPMCLLILFSSLHSKYVTLLDYYFVSLHIHGQKFVTATMWYIMIIAFWSTNNLKRQLCDASFFIKFTQIICMIFDHWNFSPRLDHVDLRNWSLENLKHIGWVIKNCLCLSMYKIRNFKSLA